MIHMISYLINLGSERYWRARICGTCWCSISQSLTTVSTLPLYYIEFSNFLPWLPLFPPNMAPIRSVAVVGAGISGVSAAAHLLRHGFDVVVFERSRVAGGVWVFDPRRDQDPEYPVSDASPDLLANSVDHKINSNGTAKHGNNNKGDDVLLAHAPPGPCYEGLMNNVPTTMMRTTLLNWPQGTPEHVTHREIEQYVQRLAQETGVHDATLYGTRMEEAVKQPAQDGSSGKWHVRTKTILPSKTAQGGSTELDFEHKDWSFDALVVASGHYHVPLIPLVPGLAEWKHKYPTRVMHSKSYRSPRDFTGQNVLLVGAGVSSLDIAKELDGVANRSYQSSRGGKFDLEPKLLPANSERVGGLRAFRLDEGKAVQDDNDDDDNNNNDLQVGQDAGAPIPGTVHLADGRILTDIHQVILASGYQTTYPFLKGLESDTIPVDEADDKILITADKCVTHNLHKDIFYIPDPTLSFVGVPYYTSTFSMFDFQAEVVARVYAGLAHLPTQQAMAEAHRARKANNNGGPKGLGGKAFHSLLSNQVEYMQDILTWVNEHVNEAHGQGTPMRGVDEDWYKALDEFRTKSIRLLPANSKQIQQPIASKYYQETDHKTAVEV